MFLIFSGLTCRKYVTVTFWRFDAPVATSFVIFAVQFCKSSLQGFVNCKAFYIHGGQKPTVKFRTGIKLRDLVTHAKLGDDR